MISALRKISQDSVVTLENNGMAAMFIANPLEKVTSLFQTHPSIEERILALKKLLTLLSKNKRRLNSDFSLFLSLFVDYVLSLARRIGPQASQDAGFQV